MRPIKLTNFTQWRRGPTPTPRAAPLRRGCLPMRQTLVLAVALTVLAGHDQRAAPPAVVLVTLDGARTEEMFGGLDLAVLKSTLGAKQTAETQPVYRRFWAPTAEARREKLMPFFWGTLMREHGSIAGNRALKSVVSLTNRHWFSYPGYSEILVGAAHDDVIKSNDRGPESVSDGPRVHSEEDGRRPERRRALWVVERLQRHRRIARGSGDDQCRLRSVRVRESCGRAAERAAVSDADAVGLRAPRRLYTRLALSHLATYRPRVLYLALGETDDWAHDGRYDRVLEAYARSDAYLKELWDWLQSQSDYRGRTSLLITTDHGRGRTPTDWKDHGDKHQGSGDTWVAFVSPDWTKRGEWRDHAPITAINSPRRCSHGWGSTGASPTQSGTAGDRGK